MPQQCRRSKGHRNSAPHNAPVSITWTTKEGSTNDLGQAILRSLNYFYVKLGIVVYPEGPAPFLPPSLNIPKHKRAEVQS